MKNFVQILEQQELIDKLVEHGYGQLIDVLLMDDTFTKKSRLNKSAACRKLKWKPKQLEDALNQCRLILERDIDFYQ